MQFPFTLVGFHTTLGTFTFPLTFVITDLTVRLFGASSARKIIAWVLLPTLFVSYFFSVVFSNGHYQGLQPLTRFDIFYARIVLGSFFAYMTGQFLDIVVFNRLRQLRQWWIAPACSTLFGNVIDTFIFFSVAFYKSRHNFLADYWMDIALMDFCWKLIVSILLFLPVYGALLNYLLKTSMVNSHQAFAEQRMKKKHAMRAFLRD